MGFTSGPRDQASFWGLVCWKTHNCLQFLSFQWVRNCWIRDTVSESLKACSFCGFYGNCKFPSSEALIFGAIFNPGLRVWGFMQFFILFFHFFLFYVKQYTILISTDGPQHQHRGFTSCTVSPPPSRLWWFRNNLNGPWIIRDRKQWDVYAFYIYICRRVDFSPGRIGSFWSRWAGDLWGFSRSSALPWAVKWCNSLNMSMYGSLGWYFFLSARFLSSPLTEKGQKWRRYL